MLADGFYEWKREGKTKQPYYIRLKDQGLFAFAGLWERWEEQDPAEKVLFLGSPSGGNGPGQQTTPDEEYYPDPSPHY